MYVSYVYMYNQNPNILACFDLFLFTKEFTKMIHKRILEI